MNKQEYVVAELKIVTFDAVDVITTSSSEWNPSAGGNIQLPFVPAD